MKKFYTLWLLFIAKSPGWLAGILTPRGKTYRGNVMDAKAHAIGRLANSIRVPGVIPPPPEARAQMLKMVSLFDAPGPELWQKTDIAVKGAAGDLPARLYSDTTDPHSPALIFFHGGGFVQGDLDSHDFLCAKIAKWSGGKVIAVDYRLAPENPYPAGTNDAKAAFQDICSRAEEFGIDASRTGVGGDSAGGNFSAVVMQESTKIRPAFQVLIYPSLDSHMNSRSIMELKDAYIIPYDRMMYYRQCYLGEFTDYKNPGVSPSLKIDLGDVGPSYILTGGFDPLLDEAKDYADRLKAAGNDVTYRCYPGQIHAFLSLTKVIPEGTKAVGEIADWLRKTW